MNTIKLVLVFSYSCSQGCTVTLKLKTVHFEVKSHAVTLPKPASSAEELYSAASELLRNEIKACSPSPLKLRLMGEPSLLGTRTHLKIIAYGYIMVLAL